MFDRIDRDRLDLLTPPGKAEIVALAEIYSKILLDSVRADQEEDIAHFTTTVGQAHLHGILSSFNIEKRAELINALIPLAVSSDGPARKTIKSILESCDDLVDLVQMIDAAGEEGLLTISGSNGEPFFNSEILLARLAPGIQGAEYIPKPDPKSYTQQLQVLEAIDSVLSHNADLFSGGAQDSSMFALNSSRLLQAFQDRRDLLETLIPSDELLDFVSVWREKVKIYARSGVALLEADRLALTGDEAAVIHSCIERFPPSVFIFRGVLLDIGLKEPPVPFSTALGGYLMGRVSIFPRFREATPGLDCPQWARPLEYAVIHEVSHTAHTYCMEEFEQLSGWTYVRDYKLSPLATEPDHDVSPSEFRPGNRLKIGDHLYCVADTIEDPELKFPLGEEEIIIPNVKPKGDGWIFRSDAAFVSEYAQSSPNEDYAETLTAFLLTPDKLRAAAPLKYEFMNYLYGWSPRE